MSTYPVYALWDIEPDHAHGCTLVSTTGQEYLDFYGGHAVISIGHTHPVYVKAMERQLEKIGFYSNAVRSSLQEQLAQKLALAAGYPDYRLFLCNSGAEANENALKLASFQTNRTRVLAFGKAFHGRTSGAVAVTDIPKYVSPFNSGHQVDFVPLNDIKAMQQAFESGSYAAAIVEGIQGVAGIYEPTKDFLTALRACCTQYGTLLLLDEVQSGCGRTGRYYAHAHHGIQADIIAMAKGIGNGFPVGALLIRPDIQAWYGQLGTTFGGNQLACTAALAVLQVMEEEHLVEHAAQMGAYLHEVLTQLQQAYPQVITELRGRGLMVGIQLNDQHPCAATLRNDLLFKQHIFTGAAGPYVIRLLPPLCITRSHIDQLVASMNDLITHAS